jgi:hypothetical protein
MIKAGRGILYLRLCVGVALWSGMMGVCAGGGARVEG